MTRRQQTFLATTIVILVTVVLHFVGWLSWPEQIIRQLMSPLSRATYTASLDFGESGQFGTVDELRQAYIELSNEYQSLTVDQAQLQLLQKENETLRAMLAFREEVKQEVLGVEVIGKNIDPLGSTILVNRGSDDRIDVGDPVVTDTGVLIGTVATVEPQTAIVRLINDNRSKIAATIINAEQSIGIVQGGFGISVEMDLIPQNEEIEIGDLIVTSGLSDQIPKGLLIGAVQAVEREPYQPFQRAIIEPAALLEHITLATILIQP